MAHGEGRAAKKYAKALFELVTSNDSGSSSFSELDSLRHGLKEISSVWLAHKDLRSAMANPALTLDVRAETIRAIGGKVLPQNVRIGNFLALLLENGRLTLLPQISTIFGELVDELRKLLSLQVTSAFELSLDEKREIEQSIQAQLGNLGTGSTITWFVDRDLLGGLTIKVGDRLLDSSVRGSLERARAQLF